MEFVNEFTVPTDVDTTWKTLIDLEKVAPCLPGATLEEVDGDVYTGRVKVKVGPITVTYRGTAELVDVDEDAKRAKIDAKGKETRGSGTADADVTADLVETDGGTLVHVVMNLTVTGKPAQFGRGVMAEVGSKIIDQFARQLEELVQGDGLPTTEDAPADVADESEAATVGAAPAAGDHAMAGSNGSGPASDETASTASVPTGEEAAPAASDSRRIEHDPSRADDALDLTDLAGAAAAKRVIPVVAGVLAAAAFVWWLVRR